jgi:hypothetical protein
VNSQPSQQLLRLSLLLQLERRARAASAAEMPFVMVNETLRLVAYRQALLWGGETEPKIIAVSGVTAPDGHAPLIVHYASLCAAVNRAGETTPRQYTASANPAFAPEAWAVHLPPVVVWAPLSRRPGAGLLLARDQPLAEGELRMLEFLADAYDHAWRQVAPRRGLGSWRGWMQGRRGRLGLVASALVVLLALLPVRQSALAPAEIVPQEPDVIRAPLEGVVDKVTVRPNQEVAAGDLLFNLDARRLTSQLAAAQGALDATEIELRQARQQAVVDTKARAALPVLQGKFDQQRAELGFLREQMKRVEVRAPRAGVVVLDDPNDWIGRPVAIGERVMLVADPARVEIEARLPVADAIALPTNAPLRLFLNIQPERPLDAVLTRASYQSYQGPDGVLAYRLKAKLAPEEAVPRIGLKGSAKIYGERAPLAYTLFRRPLTSLRQWLGL